MRAIWNGRCFDCCCSCCSCCFVSKYCSIVVCLGIIVSLSPLTHSINSIYQICLVLNERHFCCHCIVFLFHCCWYAFLFACKFQFRIASRTIVTLFFSYILNSCCNRWHCFVFFFVMYAWCVFFPLFIIVVHFRSISL